MVDVVLHGSDAQMFRPLPMGLSIRMLAMAVNKVLFDGCVEGKCWYESNLGASNTEALARRRGLAVATSDNICEWIQV